MRYVRVRVRVQILEQVLPETSFGPKLKYVRVRVRVQISPKCLAITIKRAEKS